MTQERLSQIRDNGSAMTLTNFGVQNLDGEQPLPGSFEEQGEDASLKRQAAESELQNTHHAIQDGKIESSSHMINAGLIGSGLKDKAEAERRKGMSTIAYMALMDQINTRINDLSERLSDIREHAANLEAELRAEYGDDFIDDAAQMYLNEDQLASLEGLSDRERDARSRELLMDTMLNSDGSIKAEYSDLTIAQLMSDYWMEEHLSNRIDDLERAMDSDDPAALAVAWKNDELSDDIIRMSTKESGGICLTATFCAKANPASDQAAAVIEAQAVTEATPAETASWAALKIN